MSSVAVTPTSLDPVLETPPKTPEIGGTVLRGLIWLGGVRWAAQLFTWASTLVIARLLKPEDYGLVTMATVLTGFLEVITDCGLGAALIQSRDLTERETEAAMGTTCLIGVAAAILVAFSAPVWARIQGDPRVTPIVQVLAMAVFLATIANVPYSMLHRKLAFGLVARAQLVRGFVTTSVTLAGAFVLQSHWALVLGYVVGRAAFTVMLVWAEPVRPRLPSADTHLSKLLRFGGILTADRILNYARNNLDIALVGATLGSRMVGLYVMATALARLPFEKLGSAFEPVAYPTFARLRDDHAALRRYFLVLSLGTMAIALPMCLGLIVTAPVLVPTVIGKQWLAVVKPLQVAAIVTPLIFHLTIVTALFNALSRVDLNLRITTATSVLTIAAVLASVHFGIVAVAAASGVAFTVVWLYAEMLAFRMIGLRLRDMLQTLLPVISSSFGMSLCVFAVSLLVPIRWPTVGRLGVEFTVGVVTYGAWALGLHQRDVVQQVRAFRAAWKTP